jgi:aminoglycoside 3-N-acetyltransferase
LLSEFVRRDPRALRSTHPIFSVAAIGADGPFLCRHLSNSSYGAGSIFERLYASDAKLLFFDVALADVCTFAHFPEQHVGVPYRYSKYFRGVTTVDGESSIGDWELYVRAIERWDFPPQPADEMRYPKELKSKGHLLTAMWEGLPLTVSSCRAIFEVISDGVRADPYYMLTGPLRPKRPQALPEE